MSEQSNMESNESGHHVVISADTHCGAALWDYKEYLEKRYHEDFDDWARSIEEGQRRTADGGRRCAAGKPLQFLVFLARERAGAAPPPSGALAWAPPAQVAIGPHSALGSAAVHRAMARSCQCLANLLRLLRPGPDQ